MKQCFNCKQILPATSDYFYRNRYRTDGWKSQCKTCSKVSAKQYRANNKHQIQQYNKSYREAGRRPQTFTDHMSSCAKRRYTEYKNGAKRRQLQFRLTHEEFMAFWQQPCAYCGDAIADIGLDRMDNGKGYSLENVTPCCKWCNRMKGALSQKQFLDRIQRISELTPVG